MSNFKSMLEKQMQKAKASGAPIEPETKAQPRSGGGSTSAEESGEEVAALSSPRKSKGGGRGMGMAAAATPRSNKQSVVPSANLNRVTVNLFDADRRALAVIKEKLGTAGHDFTNRSDSIKVALRIAAKAQREELVQAFEQVKAEDRRFKNVD